MKLTKLIQEKIHIDKQFNVNPKNEPTGDNDPSLPPDYVLSREKDDQGREWTVVNNAPPAKKYALEIGRMKKELRYYLNLPDDQVNKEIKQQVASILASLSNAEGKLRYFQQIMLAKQKYGK
jgi:hypothetical protein